MANDSEDHVVQCSICGGPCGLLGALGKRLHLQCRDCGMQTSYVQDEDASECAYWRDPEEDVAACGVCAACESLNRWLAEQERQHA